MPNQQDQRRQRQIRPRSPSSASAYPEAWSLANPAAATPTALATTTPTASTALPVLDPQSGRQDRHPQPQPNPSPALPTLVRQRQTAPGADQGTGRALSTCRRQGRRVGPAPTNACMSHMHHTGGDLLHKAVLGASNLSNIPQQLIDPWRRTTSRPGWPAGPGSGARPPWPAAPWASSAGRPWPVGGGVRAGWPRGPGGPSSRR